MIGLVTTSQQGNILFPYRLHEMLDMCESEGKSHIVSWLPGGNVFKVHKVPEFVETILPSYFNQSKYKSYQRQLNLWGFERVSKTGSDKGAYFHKKFRHGQSTLCRFMSRQRGKKTTGSSVLTKPVKQISTTISPPSSPDQACTRVNSFTSKISCRSNSWALQKDFLFGSLTKPDNEIDEDIASEFSTDQNHQEDRDSFEQNAPKLTFEGCQFFPLDEERYEELDAVLKIDIEVLSSKLANN